MQTMRLMLSVLCMVLGLVWMAVPAVAQCAWSPLGSGMDGVVSDVSALTVFNDGTGPALVAGGWFTTAGGVAANRIAKWNGTQWSPLGSGMDGNVYALTVFDDGTGPALVAGGNFTAAGGVAANLIAKWNGTQWSPLGSGMNGNVPDVSGLTVFDDGTGPALVAGGYFNTAGGVPANSIAKWNGTQWSPLGSGVSGNVDALTVFNDGTGTALYAGGGFTTAGGVAVNHIAKWNGTQWSPLGSGMNDYGVSALTVFDDGTGPALVAGGSFTAAGGVAANRIAKWNGTGWSPLGSGMNDFVSTLTVFDDGTGPALVAGGAFTTAGGVPANYIAKWNGTQWSPLGSGMNDLVDALTVFNDGTGPALVAGGGFTTAGGVAARNIAKWSCAPPPPPRTIFLLHGIHQNAGDMINFAANLRSRLDPSRFVVDAGFDFGRCAFSGCPDSCTLGGSGEPPDNNGARVLAGYIASRAPQGDIIILGFSMGGLIARDMILNQFSDYQVTALITLGTPNLGYPYSVIKPLVVCGSVARQMFGDWRNPPDPDDPDQQELRDSIGQRVTVSSYLHDLNTRWSALPADDPRLPASWGAAAGTFCDNPIRIFSTRGCSNGTRNDGTVCAQSAAFNFILPNPPTDRWDDPRHAFAHTDNPWADVFCFGRRPVLWDPPRDGDLMDWIVNVVTY